MRLLIIEDDKNLALVIREGLEKRGFSIDISNTAADGEEKALINGYDAILLDLNLPDNNGLNILSSLRERKLHAPIVIITARDEVSQRAYGLNSGADDYVTKPFDFVELEARIRAVIRRSYGRTKNEIKIGQYYRRLQNPFRKRGGHFAGHDKGCGERRRYIVQTSLIF